MTVLSDVISIYSCKASLTRQIRTVPSIFKYCPKLRNHNLLGILIFAIFQQQSIKCKHFLSNAWNVNVVQRQTCFSHLCHDMVDIAFVVFNILFTNYIIHYNIFVIH